MRNIVVIPGSFNPFHAGHEFMGNYCREEFNAEVFYEITVNNIDKGLIDRAEIDRRLKAIDDKGWRAITCPHPSFIVKTKYYARYFPSAFYGDWYKETVGIEDYFYFAVGMDTFTRILNPDYASGNEMLNHQLKQMIEAGVKFLIFDRNDISYNKVVQNYRSRFSWNNLTNSEFSRLFYYLGVKAPNISSTELRSRDVR